MANPQNKSSQSEGQTETTNDTQSSNQTSQAGNTGLGSSGAGAGGIGGGSTTSTSGTGSGLSDTSSTTAGNTGMSGGSSSTGLSGGTGTLSSTTPAGGMAGTSSTSGTGGGGGMTGTAAATARSFYDQAKETAGQAYEAVTEKAATKLDERKTTLTTPLSTVAESVRQMSANLGSATTDSGLAEAAAKYTDTAAQKIESFAGYFETRSVRDMAQDLESFARRNPAVFLGAAFGLGILVARFLKSTPPNFDRGSGEFNSSFGTDHQLTSGSERGDTGNTPNIASNPM